MANIVWDKGQYDWSGFNKDGSSGGYDAYAGLNRPSLYTPEKEQQDVQANASVSFDPQSAVRASSPWMQRLNAQMQNPYAEKSTADTLANQQANSRAYGSNFMDKQDMPFNDRVKYLQDNVYQGEGVTTKDGQQLSFQDRIKNILDVGNQRVNAIRNPEAVSLADIVKRNQDSLGTTKDMAWAHQDPMGENMGYEWNDAKMKELGWSDDDITGIKGIRDMHPQMIEDLYNRGILRAPYREYLAKQEELRRQAEAQAAAQRASYGYGGDGGSESTPAPTPTPTPEPRFKGNYAIENPKPITDPKQLSYESLKDMYDTGFRE